MKVLVLFRAQTMELVVFMDSGFHLTQDFNRLFLLSTFFRHSVIYSETIS
jgi:hypothetical protein